MPACPRGWDGPRPASFERRNTLLEVATSAQSVLGPDAYYVLAALWRDYPEILIVTEYVGDPSPSAADFSARHAAYEITEQPVGLIDGWRPGQAIPYRFFYSMTRDSVRRNPDPHCALAVCTLDPAQVVVEVACDPPAPVAGYPFYGPVGRRAGHRVIDRPRDGGHGGDSRSVGAVGPWLGA